MAITNNQPKYKISKTNLYHSKLCVKLILFFLLVLLFRFRKVFIKTGEWSDGRQQMWSFKFDVLNCCFTFVKLEGCALSYRS